MHHPVKHFFVAGIFRYAYLILLILFVFLGCTKIDTTDLGGDLIPEVDNVNTFADTLDISSTQGLFSPDSVKVFRTDVHALGSITDDPLFGETKASIYLQLKPNFYPYFYGKAGDTINPALAPGTGFDSVVLCLSYRGFWGDTTIPMNLQVVQVLPNNNAWDSVLQTKSVNYAPQTGTVLGGKTVDLRRVRDVVKYANRRDSASGMVRIRLTGLEPSLFQCDTTTNNYFRTDSLFKLFNNGLGITAQGGRGLMYISLTDTATKLEVHFRRKNKGGIDTSYSSFKLELLGAIDTAGRLVVKPSSTANNIIRNRLPLSPGNSELMLQSQPGTYAEMFIDSLNNYGNRIVHRAFIRAEQIPENVYYDSIYSAPPLLYLDLRDTSVSEKYKPLYFDLNPNTRYDPDFSSGLPFFPNGGVDFGYYGGFLRYTRDNSGRSVVYYEFNVTRYLQQLVTKGTPNYKMRVFAPFTLYYPQYSTTGYTYGNRIALGRVKLGGGSHPEKPLKLVVIYSKLRG